MFKPATLRVFAVLAMVLSVCGLLINLLLMQRAGLTAVLGAASWVLLLWASWLGFRLAGYKLYAEEYKKVGIRIYLTIGAFALFLLTSVTVGLVLAVVLLGAQWGLKRNYDDWQPSEPAEADAA